MANQNIEIIENDPSIVSDTAGIEENKNSSVTVNMVLDDCKRAMEYWRPWRKAAMSDFDFAFGDQWEDDSVKTLENRGVKALTYNEIQANLFLLSGIQRQNRSDYKAFPEGEEDSLKGEIITRLLKNIMKVTRGEAKLSEQFDSMTICGMGYIDPFIDYTFDLVSGDMKLKNESVFKYFPDPDFEEYDLSDGKYLIKYTTGLNKNQLKSLFPGKDKIINKLSSGKFEFQNSSNGVGTQGDRAEPDKPGDDYHSTSGSDVSSLDGTDKNRDSSFELIEYFYQNWKKKYIVVDQESGQMREFESNDEALEGIEVLRGELTQAFQEAQDPQSQQEIGEKLERFDDPDQGLVIIERLIPEMWIKSLTGPNVLLEDEPVWSYPNYKKYPIISLFGHRTNVRLSKRENMIQGIVRSIKDPQMELNKRKTQKLQHLNASTNSGWIGPKGCFVQIKQWKKFGNAPGAILEWNQDIGEPRQIFPQQLSQGHTQLEVEASDSIKKITGINADLLAANESQASGKAINLRTKQGLVMVQKLFDNAAETKKLLALFLMSQFPEIYTVKKAMRVLGQAWLEDNFTEQVQDEAGPVVDLETGEPQMQYNEQAAIEMITEVLNDSKAGIFDVSIGESISAETIKMANFEHIMEMVQNGIQIPIDVIVDNSLLETDQKEKIKQALANQQQPSA